MATLTQEEFETISDFTIPDTSPIEIWIAVANGYLSTFMFDESLDGFESAYKLIAVAIVENFYAGSRQAAILSANSPYIAEKFGSYSYRRFDNKTDDNQQEENLFTSLPVAVQAIFIRYLLEPDPRIITSSVFKELQADGDGVREWQPYNDYDLAKVTEW